MIAKTVAQAPTRSDAAKKSSLLRRCARALFLSCAPLAPLYGFVPLPDEALYRQPRDR